MAGGGFGLSASWLKELNGVGFIGWPLAGAMTGFAVSYFSAFLLALCAFALKFVLFKWTSYFNTDLCEQTGLLAVHSDTISCTA